MLILKPNHEQQVTQEDFFNPDLEGLCLGASYKGVVQASFCLRTNAHVVIRDKAEVTMKPV